MKITRILSLLFCSLAQVAVAAQETVGERSGDPSEGLFNLSFEELLAIRVSSATKTPLKISEAPAIMSVITAEDIEAYDFFSLADVLSTLPGFDVLYDLSVYNAGIRGINAGLNGQSQVFKVMLDGQDMAFRPTTGNFIGPEFIPAIAIERVEVIRGPMSALYGANAFLGAVNVIAKRAEQGQSTEATFKAGYIDDFTNGGYQAQLGLATSSGKLAIYAAAGVEQRDRGGLQLPSSSPRFQALAEQGELSLTEDNEEVTSLYLRADYRLDSDSELAFNGLYQSFVRDGNFQPDSEPLREAVVGFDNSMLHLQYKKTLRPDLLLTANFSVNQGQPSKHSRQYDPFRQGVAYLAQHYDSTQYSSAIELNYSMAESLNLVAGLDYSFDKETLPTLLLVAEDESIRRINDGRKTEIDNRAGFLQLSWQALDSLSLIGGMRTDQHSIYGQQNTYRVGLVNSFGEDSVLKLLSGSSFKAPSVMLMFGGQHPRFFGPLANRSLAPQQAKTTELNISTSLAQSLRLGLTVYDTKVEDFAEYDTLAANPQARNRARIDILGMEAELRFKSSSPAIDAFLSLSNISTNVSDDTVAAIEVSQQTRLYPQLSLSAGFNYHFAAGDWRIFGVFQYIDQRAADKSNLPFLPVGQQQEYFLPSYQLWDIGLERAHLDWFGQDARLKLALKNAFEENYQVPGFSGIDVPGLGRQIYLTYTQNF